MKNILNIFIPKEEIFFDMLKKQSENAVRSSLILKELLDNYETLSETEKKFQVEKIEELEKRGDKQTHEIMETLDKTFITPIDREDIHAACILLDDVIDLIEEVAKKFLLFRIENPSDDMKNLARLITQAVKEADEGIYNLKNFKKIKQSCINIHNSENEANSVHYKAMAELFHNGKLPIDVIKEKDIYEILEKITDKCEDIAHILESILVKNA